MLKILAIYKLRLATARTELASVRSIAAEIAANPDVNDASRELGKAMETIAGVLIRVIDSLPS